MPLWITLTTHSVCKSLASALNLRSEILALTSGSATSLAFPWFQRKELMEREVKLARGRIS